MNDIFDVAEFENQVEAYFRSESYDHDPILIRRYARMARHAVTALESTGSRWFILTTLRALRASYHDMNAKELADNRVLKNPTFSTTSATYQILHDLLKSVFHINLVIEDEVVVLLNMKKIQVDGYVLNATRYLGLGVSGDRVTD